MIEDKNSIFKYAKVNLNLSIITKLLLSSPLVITNLQNHMKSPFFLMGYFISRHINATCTGGVKLSGDILNIFYLLNVRRRVIMLKKGG